jgi:hypothetical protein
MMSNVEPDDQFDDDEFDEFDITPEEINRVIDEGEPVEFGDNVVIKRLTFGRARTEVVGHAEELDVAAATG